ncbi:MAG: hypothetical protein F4W92_01315 [Gammaproteobacteria bacterium]|nr:hypothetical protein [Gammaproteobacteria bacterium]
MAASIDIRDTLQHIKDCYNVSFVTDRHFGACRSGSVRDRSSSTISETRLSCFELDTDRVQLCFWAERITELHTVATSIHEA